MYYGVPDDYGSIRTIGDLLDSEYVFASAPRQLRENLMMRLGDDDRYPGIIGLDSDVIPALDRAILAGHDVLLVGQIGQAKTRLAQVISSTLLSPMPIIHGSITNDTPYDLPPGQLAALLQSDDAASVSSSSYDTMQKSAKTPQPASTSSEFHISPESSEYILDNGRDAKIGWVSGLDRSKFVVATPDITVKDMVGYIDVAKVAKKGVEMYDISTYSPGYLMQAKHGIFCIDELPVLDTRKQVALLSVLQDGLFTAGSYPVVFRPRTVLFATANPVDYTHSGRIIEPLYDRLKSHIRTRYPNTIQDEMRIILQEANIPGNAIISDAVLHVLAGIIRNVRASPLVNREKGVSVRMGIHGLELLAAEAYRARPDAVPSPRISDMHCLYQVARFELSEIDDTPQNRHDTLHDIINQTIQNYDDGINNVAMEPSDADKIKSEFEGAEFHTSNTMSYVEQLQTFPALRSIVERFAGNGNFHTLDAKNNSEIKEAVMPVMVEIALEWLCRRTPKILERRDSGYVLA